MRRCLVTGASSETGQTVIRALLDDGWEVVGTSRTPPGLGHEWPRFRWHCMDLADDRFIYGLRNAIAPHPLDMLVHCAPEYLLTPVVEQIGHEILGGTVYSGPAYLATRGRAVACTS